MSAATRKVNRATTAQVVIAAGTAVSTEAVIPLDAQQLQGVFIPTAGWTNANVTFQASVDGTNWYDLYNAAGTEIALTVGALTANRFVQVSAPFALAPRLRLRSGTAATPVNQASAMTLTLVFYEA